MVNVRPCKCSKRRMKFAFLAGALCLFAQEPVIRTTVPLVLLPVSATDHSGTPVNGLTERDFLVLDDGKPVKHTLEITNQPISLVVAVQTSSAAGPAIAKVQKIGPMFEPLVVGAGGEAAILTYSNHVKLWQPFTHSGDEFTRRMRKILPDGTEARANDAVVEAVRLLSVRPGYRRVLVLIGESRDRGSEARLQEAISQAQAANVTIYPVTYSVYATSFTSRGAETFAGTDRRVFDADGPMNLLAVFGEIGRMASENGADAMASYTGGEKVSFTKFAGLEKVIAAVGRDLHSQYLLSFLASKPERGVYRPLTVTVSREGVTVRTRPGYWLE